MSDDQNKTTEEEVSQGEEQRSEPAEQGEIVEKSAPVEEGEAAAAVSEERADAISESSDEEERDDALSQASAPAEEEGEDDASLFDVSPKEDPVVVDLPAPVEERSSTVLDEESDPEESDPEEVAPELRGEVDEPASTPEREQPSLPVTEPTLPGAGVDGLAAYFDDPHELLIAAEEARDEGFRVWDAYSPFPIHGIEDAMGIGRSWLPWVTFGAGGTGFLTANALQFGMLTFDWPMIIGGKPHAPWPSFVPIMFELTVLIGGVTSALVMFIAAGCFRKPRIIDPEITNDRFVLWIDAKDPKFSQAHEFMSRLEPVEIRPVTF